MNGREGAAGLPGARITALAVGQVTHDRYGDRILPGGCAFYGARTLAALGAHVGLATAVGGDFDCDAALAGLDVMRATGGRTTAFVNIYRHDGARVQWVDAMAPQVAPAVLEPRWARADVVFFAPVFGELELQPWLGAVGGGIRGLGLQGLLKQPGSLHPEVAGRRAVERRPFEVDARALAGVDAVFLSEEDVAHYGSPRLLEDLRRTVPVVSLTRGERGATVYARGEVLEVSAAEVAAVDPTGAGDTYAAAFLLGLARGDPLPAAARLATAAASVVVEGRGGERLPRVGEAYRRATEVSIAVRTAP